MALRAEDYRWRSGGTGRRTRRARMRRMPGPEPARVRQVPGGTSTPGINLYLKDRDRMGRGPRTAEVDDSKWTQDAARTRGM